MTFEKREIGRGQQKIFGLSAGRLIPGGLVLFAAVCDSHTVACQDTARTSDAKDTASYANETQ